MPEIKKFVKKNKGQIVDIILFGSASKGKTKVKDIDIAIIFRNKEELNLVRELDTVLSSPKLNFHISSLTADNFFTKSHSLVQSLLYEGISLVSGKSLSSNFNLDGYAMYNYDLSGFDETNKVRFVYLLKGRNKEKGIITRLNGRFIVPGCFIVPVDKDDEIREILDKWQVHYNRNKIFFV